ncbi:MAG TPA: NeuD/PglB/VioB family sugar acetyltransferase, partial [Gemmatimonadaceae bacterium]|nr:NeuD/PglB/VioB family sugar acetyltransferase [Gemmatimonadaceae bacterium]
MVWGGGGHGRVVADVATALGYEVIAFIDQDPDRLHSHSKARATAFVPEKEFLDPRSAEKWDSARIVLGIGDNAARLKCFTGVAAGRLVSIIHPSAVVSSSVTVGRGSVVFAQAVVNSDAIIGDAVIINTGAVVEHDCVLGDGVHVAPGAILTGSVKVGKGTLIGAGVVVIPGITIGENSIVGAGTVVTAD